MKQHQNTNMLAAIDIGSNSFHMMMARLEQGELRTIDKLGEKVQLAAGIKDGILEEFAIKRGIDCLLRFKQRIDACPEPVVLRVVGTNALRAVKNPKDFIVLAEEVLGVPVEVIAGREEARLVYLGVAHCIADDYESRLVIDIGGGSTELIIGQRFESRIMESMHMGCVSYMRFFPEGMISEENFNRAYNSAASELSKIVDSYQNQWSECVGSSGTLLAIEQVLINAGLSEGGITRSGLESLHRKLLSFENFSEVHFDGLKEHRRPVIASGIAITKALFDTLDIQEMKLSSGALREGVLYDLVGRLSHEDVRERSVFALEQRYAVDTKVAGRVAKYCEDFFSQVKDVWQFDEEDDRFLHWAARLHEIGLTVSHSQFHKHGEYLLRYSDLAGFSQQDQEFIALLVRAHRRKWPHKVFVLAGFSDSELLRLQQLAVLLRLSVMLKNIDPANTPEIAVEVLNERVIQLSFDKQWLDDHPLTNYELQQEIEYLSRNNSFVLTLKEQ